MDIIEKELKNENIPWDYSLCFNDACGQKDKCMHYQARLLKADIMKILAKFGPTEGLNFDHYVMEWDFD